MNLGDEEGARAGHPDRYASGIGGVEGCDRVLLAIDERALEAFGATCCPFSVRTEPCAAGTRSGECVGNHDVHVDPVGAEPGTGVFS